MLSILITKYYPKNNTTESYSSWLNHQNCCKFIFTREMKVMSKKRVDIVSLQMIKEKSVMYEARTIRNPFDVFVLLKDFLENFKIASRFYCQLL